MREMIIGRLRAMARYFRCRNPWLDTRPKEKLHRPAASAWHAELTRFNESSWSRLSKVKRLKQKGKPSLNFLRYCPLTIAARVPKFHGVSSPSKEGFIRSISSQFGRIAEGKAEKSFAARLEIQYDREINSLGSVNTPQMVGLRGKGAEIAKLSGVGAIASNGRAA